MIGFNAGDGSRFFQVPGTVAVLPDIGNDTFNLELESAGNTGVAGLYLYRVDLDTILSAEGRCAYSRVYTSTMQVPNPDSNLDHSPYNIMGDQVV